MREWLPDLVLTSAAGVGALRLTDIQAFSGNCSVVSKLQSWACSFKSSARWPPVGVEAGPGYVYFPELSTSTRAASPALAAWRVNVTCPAADWATLVGPLQPCGTVTVRTGEQLLAALAQLQPTHAQLLLTLAANISLPASPTDQLSPSSPDDSNPLGVIYRNTTFAGLRAGINSSSAPAALRTELDVRSRRNALQLLTTLPPGALPLTTMPSSLGAAANSTNSSPINTSSSSGSNSSAGRVALNLCDLTLVNMPPGQPSTWPVGLTAVEMWHLGVDRSPGAPVQARHVRVALMYNVGQLRYLSFWFARLTSMVAEEQQSAKWLGDILTPPLQATDADGQLTSVGTTRSYLEKYNTTTAATPLLTAPMPAVVDLWSVEDPPADPSIILFAANVTQLRAQLQRPWSGPRVIVLLDDIVLDASNWSNEGILVASDITVSGPSAAGTLTTPAAVAAFYSNLSSSPTSPTSAPTTPATFASTIIAEHRQHSRQLLLYLSSLPLALPPPGNRLSLRNLHVVNASLSVTWALPAAPAVLPRVPGYDLWRGRCLPGFNDQSIGRFEFNGCSADAPPDFFALLKLFNSPTCTTSAATGAVVCTVPGVAKIAAGFPYLPDELNGLFNQLLVASGQVPVAQPTNDTLFYTAHTAGGAWWNSTTFHLIPQRATAPSSSSSSGGSGSSSGGNATVAAASPPPPLSVMALALSGPCDLQTLLTLLRAANSSSRTNSSGSSGGAASSSTDTGVIVGAVVGCVVGVGLLAAAAFFGRRAYLTRHDQRRDQEKQRADQEKQQPDTQQHKLPAATAGERDGSNGDLCRDAKDDSLSGAADGGAAPAADSGWGSSSKGAGKAAVAVGSAAAAAAAPGVAGLSPAEVRISISQQEDGPAQERALLALPLAAGGQHDVAAAAAHADGAPQHLWEGSAFSKSFAAGTAGGATMLEVVMPGVAHAAAAAAAAGGGGGGGRAHPVDGFPLPPPHGGWGGHSALPSSLQMAPPDTPQQQLQQPQTHVKHAELVPPGALPPGTAGAAAAAAAAGGADVLRAASLLPGGAWPPPQGLPGPHPPRPPPPISPLQAHYAAPGVRRVMDMRAGDGMPGSGPASGATGGGVMGPGSGGATPRGGLTSEREAGSSVAADLMQQTLAGEIDGLIRRFQDTTPVGAQPVSNGGQQRPRVLGSGGCGVVYKGEWRGLPVAIKVVLLQEGDSTRRRERLVREVALAVTLSHANVVPTFHYTVQPVEVAGLAHMSLPLPAAEPPLPPAAAGGVGSPAPTQASAGMPRCDAYKLSIIMAYCDGGTLRDALRLGLFRKPWPPPAAAPAGGGGGSGVTGYVLGGGGLHNQQSQNQVYVQRQGSKAAAFVAALGTGGAPVEGPPAAATVAAAVGGGAAATSPGVGASPSASTSAEPAPQQQQQQQQPQQQQQQLGSSSSSLLPPLQENAGAAAHAAVAMPSAAGRRVSTGPPSARGQGRRPCSSGQIQLPADGGGGAAAPGGSGGSGGASPPPTAMGSAVVDGEQQSYPIYRAWRDVGASPNLALALFAALDVARGLEYLHTCNVVHGDLTLQNILLASCDPVFPELLGSGVNLADLLWFNSVSVGGGSVGSATVAGDGGGGADGGGGGGGRHMTAADVIFAQQQMFLGSMLPSLCVPDQPDSWSEDILGPPHAVPAAAQHAVTQAVSKVAEAPPGPAAASSSTVDNAAAGTTPGITATGHATVTTGTTNATTVSTGASLGAAAVASSGSGLIGLTPIDLNDGGGGVLADAAVGTAAATAGLVADSATPFRRPASTSTGTSGPLWVSGTTSAAPAAAAAADGRLSGGRTAASGLSAGAVMSGGAGGVSASGAAGGGTSARGGGGVGKPLNAAMRAAHVMPLLGQVFKISDFGLSVRLEGDETHRSGLHQGTPFFAAPEVLVSGKVSPAADVYSFGICLWCLSHGASLCQLRQLLPHIFTPVAPSLLAHMSPELPPSLRNLLRRCLAGDASKRPAASVLVAELTGLLQVVVGPTLAPVLLRAERRQREVGRAVAGMSSLQATSLLATAPGGVGYGGGGGGAAGHRSPLSPRQAMATGGGV